MRRLLWIASLTLLIQNWGLAQAQDSTGNTKGYIIYATAYNKGVYRTFEDFKYNRPSIVDFSIIHNKPYVNNEKTGRLRKLKDRDAWGYSDGSKVYIKRARYQEMLGQGRYCYYVDKGWRLRFIMAPPFIFPTPYSHTVITNFNTGKSYVLTKKLLKTILDTDDKELLKEFTAETGKNKKLLIYIDRYNQRNSHKVK